MEKDFRNISVPNASILPEWRTNRFTVINVASVGELLVGASNCWSELLVNHLLQTTNFFSPLCFTRFLVSVGTD